jgi:hypothetical protein
MTSRGWFGFLVLRCASAEAKEYPVWFIHQGALNCRIFSMGYAAPSPLKDSTISCALQNAAINAAAYERVMVKGEQAFWGTEAGNIRINSATSEFLDSDEIKKVQSVLRVLNYAVSEGCMLVLAGDSNCILSQWQRQRLPILQVPAPRWTEEIPKETNVLYAVGLAPKYYYESSSWSEAEWMARRNLARIVQSNVHGIQKSSVEGQLLEMLSLDVALNHVEVVERWLDVQ